MHRVLVDFENTPTTALGEPGGQPVEVTLPPGKSQERLGVIIASPVERGVLAIDVRHHVTNPGLAAAS
jgi:hypothetical protein